MKERRELIEKKKKDDQVPETKKSEPENTDQRKYGEREKGEEEEREISKQR